MAEGAHFEVYPSERDVAVAGEKPATVTDYRWRLRSANGEIVASGEGYDSEYNADRACADVVRIAVEASTIRAALSKQTRPSDPPAGFATKIEHVPE